MGLRLIGKILTVKIIWRVDLLEEYKDSEEEIVDDSHGAYLASEKNRIEKNYE